MKSIWQCNGSQLIEEIEQISEMSCIINVGDRQMKDRLQPKWGSIPYRQVRYVSD
jgi:hypothetical protein